MNFDDDMLYECFMSESNGGSCSKLNGFYHGKHMMDITIKMWKEDISLFNLHEYELYNDTIFPIWWLDKILKKN